MPGGLDNVGDRGQDPIDKTTNNETPQAADENQAIDFLALTKVAERQNQQFIGALQRSAWQNSHRAYRNQHVTQSKYLSPPYRNRSKIFRPKTRTAVRNGLAVAASALFSTRKVVSVEAQYDDDPIQNASAACLQAMLDYRLDRTNARAGIPWFLMAMGGCLDSQIHGICGSKQFWEYEEIQETHEVTYEDTVAEHQIDDVSGAPMYDQLGQPVLTTHTEQRTEMEQKRLITKDRPMCMLLPPENMMVDPAAPWYDPVQLSHYFIGKFPMTVEDARTMLKNPGKSETPWLPVSDGTFDQAMDDYSTKGVRIDRSGGVDRYDNRETAGADDHSGIVWMLENFWRVEGTDYHFWSVGTRAYASQPRATREAYPEQMGSRPYTYGYGSIEPHTITPMAAVESWLQMQMEANDMVNLRLDTMKQALSPIAKVRQGSLFDWKQLQHRGGADTTIIVRQPDDLMFEKTPDVGASAYQEMNNLNADFDSLAGHFDGGSVNTNRQLNETVGGMRLLSGAANSVKEFDLRVWVETWVEPTIRQIVHAIQYYESDEKIFKLAPKKAKMFERFGVSEISDADLESEVSVKVDVGIGAADPFQKLQKFGAAMGIIAQAAPFMDKKPVLVSEEFIPEVMGSAGYSDGMRFFSFDQPPGAGQDPAQLEIQMKAQLEQARMTMDQQIAAEKNQNTLEVEQMRSRAQILGHLIDEMAATKDAAAEREHASMLHFRQGIFDLGGEQIRGNFARQIAKEKPKPKPASASK